MIKRNEFTEHYLQCTRGWRRLQGVAPAPPTHLVTRLTRLRLHALLLLHLVGIVLPVILLAHHVLTLLTRLPGHPAHLLLHPGHPMRSLRQLRTHAHLVRDPSGHGIANGICERIYQELNQFCFSEINSKL